MPTTDWKLLETWSEVDRIPISAPWKFPENAAAADGKLATSALDYATQPYSKWLKGTIGSNAFTSVELPATTKATKVEVLVARSAETADKLRFASIRLHTDRGVDVVAVDTDEFGTAEEEEIFELDPLPSTDGGLLRSEDLAVDLRSTWSGSGSGLVEVRINYVKIRLTYSQLSVVGGGWYTAWPQVNTWEWWVRWWNRKRGRGRRGRIG